MSLDRYRRPRLIVLNAHDSAYEAARSMADHKIGAVLVQNGELIGIVTDRDLALDVVAADLHPCATTLHDVMSDEVASVDIDATVDDVVRVMLDHACRRVPVLSDGKAVGIVTLDDLLLDEAIDLSTARAIIAAQLEVLALRDGEETTSSAGSMQGEPNSRTRSQLRRAARAENTYGRLLHDVMRETQLDTRERAEQALLIVLSALSRRLTPNAARHLLAQLPSKLATSLDRPFEGPDKNISAESIEAQLRHTLHLVPENATEVLYAVCEAVSDSVSAGEIESVRAELPTAMKDLFPSMPYRRAS
jgi:CBS domain-containing protein/uncharacterized protein (DUF2267 family)